VWATARSKVPGDREPVCDRVRKYVERSAFWGSLQHITNAMEPMRDVLRLADSDEPSMGVAYASLLNLRNRELKLSENPATANKRREDVKRIVEKRMEFVLKPVYRAAFALNPRYRTEPFSGEVLSDIEQVLERTLGAEESIKALTVFQSYYRTGRRVSSSMEKAAKQLPPHEWWKIWWPRAAAAFWHCYAPACSSSVS
jgi:hypothetical protein